MVVRLWYKHYIKYVNQVIFVQDYDDDFDLDWLPDQIDGFVYLPGTINLRPFKGIKPSTFIDDFNINVMGCVKILQKVLPRLQS